MVVVTRELTKLYETVVRGPLGTIDIGDARGEYVFVLAGAPVEEAPIDDETIRTPSASNSRAGRRTATRRPPWPPGWAVPSATSTPSPSPSVHPDSVPTANRARRR